MNPTMHADELRRPVALRGDVIHLCNPYLPSDTLCGLFAMGGAPYPAMTAVTCLMCLARWDAWARQYAP